MQKIRPSFTRTSLRPTMLAILLLLLIGVADTASAQTFRLLHFFVGEDGALPRAGVTVDQRNGKIYGTTFSGFLGFGWGSAYEIRPFGQNFVFNVIQEFDGQPVDTRLVLLARYLGAKVVTHDYNLNKVAQVHGIEVVNLNDVAQALKPVFLPGEQLEVHLIKPGEAPGQGIGYLDDGTMIVVEGGRDRLNETVKVTVTSVLQTSAGRMIFGKS